MNAFAVHQRGHGDAARPPAAYRPEDLAAAGRSIAKEACDDPSVRLTLETPPAAIDCTPGADWGTGAGD